MVNNNDLKALRDKLVEKQTLQKSSRESAEKAVKEIQEIINTLNERNKPSSEDIPDYSTIYDTYPAIYSVLSLNAKQLMENRELVENTRTTLRELVELIKNDLEGVLNV